MVSMKEQLEQIKNLKIIFDLVSDGNTEAANILIYIKSNYRNFGPMILWLKRNNIRGQRLVDFFKNESDETGGGYLLGCTLILSRLDGHKDTLKSVKITDLY